MTKRVTDPNIVFKTNYGEAEMRTDLSDNVHSLATTLSRKGETAYVGIFGELKAGEVIDNISVKFMYGVSQDYDVDFESTGDGTVSQEGSMAVVSSTTGTARLSSQDTVRYRPGHTCVINMTALFEGTGEGSVGAFDADSGIFITYNNGDVSVSYRNEAVDTTVNQTDFNGEDLSDIDFTNLNVYQISFGYLGTAPILIEVMKANGEFVAIHKFKTAGQMKGTHISNPILPIAIETSGDMTVKTGSWNAHVLGNGTLIGARPFCTEHTEVIPAGTTATIVNYRNKTTFNSRPNQVKANLMRIGIHVDSPNSGGGDVITRIRKGGTLSGTPSYTSVDANNSVMEYDTVANYSSGGILSLVEYEGYVQSAKSSGVTTTVNSERLGLTAYPGDVFSIVVENDGTADITYRVSLNWEELF